MAQLRGGSRPRPASSTPTLIRRSAPWISCEGSPSVSASGSRADHRVKPQPGVRCSTDSGRPARVPARLASRPIGRQGRPLGRAIAVGLCFRGAPASVLMVLTTMLPRSGHAFCGQVVVVPLGPGGTGRSRSTAGSRRRPPPQCSALSRSTPFRQTGTLGWNRRPIRMAPPATPWRRTPVALVPSRVPTDRGADAVEHRPGAQRLRRRGAERRARRRGHGGERLATGPASAATTASGRFEIIPSGRRAMA